jgi:hypothetical protein
VRGTSQKRLKDDKIQPRKAKKKQKRKNRERDISFGTVSTAAAATRAISYTLGGAFG